MHGRYHLAYSSCENQRHHFFSDVFLGPFTPQIVNFNLEKWGMLLGYTWGKSQSQFIRKSSILKYILLTVFYRLRICSIAKFLYQPGLTATAGFLGGGELCFVKRALKKQSLHHKKETVALLDITKHPCETRNVETYIVNYKRTYFQKLQVHGHKVEKSKRDNKTNTI